MSPPCLSAPYYSNVDDHLQPGPPPRLCSPLIRTAPPSPMRPHRLPSLPPVELAKQGSLDELRTTVQLAASSMESSTKDIKLLGEKMAAATERVSDTVQDNSQALVLLTRVVDRLQSLLITTKAEIDCPHPVVSEHDGTPKKGPKNQEQRPSLTHQSRCSFPSFPSSTLSSSLSSSPDAPFTSHGTSSLSLACLGSPRAAFKTSNAPLLQKKDVDAVIQASRNLLTNSPLDVPTETSPTVKGDHSNQRKKRRKKTT